MATNTYTKNIPAVNTSTGSSSADKYTLKFVVTTTKNTGNSTKVKMVGYIKSNNSAYTAYNGSSGGSNTLKIIDEDGKTQYSTMFKATYDTRDTGTYDQVFSKTVTITHGSDGARGIRFVWSFSDSARSVQPKGTLYAPSSSSTLALTTTTYTIKYNANKGTGAPASQTKTYGKTLTLSSTKPTRAAASDGTTYTFKGWATSDDGAVAYKAGGSYSKNASATLYAVWSSVSNYDIVYYANGGRGAPEKQTKASGKTITLSTKTPTRDGYTFKGWGISEDSTTVKYKAGASYSTNDDLILYAIWEAWTYTIEFNANGGSGTPSSIIKTADIPVLIPEEEPTRDGYIFRGWNEKSDGSGKIYSPTSTFDIIQNGGTITLYAHWANTDILIYNSGECKAFEFSEGDITAVYSGGIFVSTEFVEGNTMSLKANVFTFTELIEK